MRILVSRSCAERGDAVKLLEEAGIDLVFQKEGDLVNDPNLREMDGIFLGIYTKVNGEFFAKLGSEGKLKFIISASSGLDHIDLKMCEEKGIKVYSASGANAASVASHAIGLMLAVVRKTVQADKLLREGKWDKEKFMSFDLEGKVLGIVGFGNIGKEVAKQASGFGMKVLVFDPHVSEGEVKKCELVYGVKSECLYSLEDLLKRADVVTVHVPLLEATKGMIGGKELGLMKPSSVLINTSRGEVIDEKALVRILKEKKIHGAGLDVFQEEPEVSKGLLELENVVLTPHIGAMTEKSFRKMGIQAVQKFLESVSG